MLRSCKDNMIRVHSMERFRQRIAVMDAAEQFNRRWLRGVS